MPFSNPWWVAGREVSVLESFCALKCKMCADIKDCLLNLSPFKRVVSRKIISLSQISDVNLMGSGHDCLLGQ